ncbi:glycosyltransferase family 2 protein [Plenodomus tracheiphilus IPT5]|uniref:chitin synthase n=1 Tax=Plenodomus tracheiphilus IPT5 TaxID=1408161 RepID=A0A6A7AYJ3_9PLEO|nr:glycosyltransferase family 2 protein [Plenodomus tracheiphilus IPT5]
MSIVKPFRPLELELPRQPNQAYLRPESMIIEGISRALVNSIFEYIGYHSDISRSTTLVSNDSHIDQFEKIPTLREKSEKRAAHRAKQLGSLNTQVEAKPIWVDFDGSKTRRAGRLMKLRKFAFQFMIYGFNGFLIFGYWWFRGYHYVFVPFIAVGVLINFVVVMTLLIWLAFRRIRPEIKGPPPLNPDTLMLVIPCYNESEDELRRSIDSLVEQRGIHDHKQACFIICDGRVRGPGMAETTGDCLLNTILTKKTSRKHLKDAYIAFDRERMDVIIQKGTYRGLPYMCIVKMTNKGKRDGIILLRSFAHKFNQRFQSPKTIFSNEFFGEMASFSLDTCGIHKFDQIVGMDADSVFDPWCIWYLLDEMRYPNCYGVCGVVWVDFKDGPWNLWRLLQNAAYTVSQGLPRLHQSIVTHKVTCLPGCCQILKVCEENNGDHPLRTLFGYCPSPADGMLKHLRGAYSEDRNHVCNVLTCYPYVQTRQAIRAVAWTDVPTSLSVFASQRKRWSLGATVNDMDLMLAKNTQWFERIRAFGNVQAWFCNVFIVGSIAGLIHVARHAPWYVTVGILSGVIIQYIYMLSLAFWMPKTRKAKLQYVVGLVIFLITGPFLTLYVLFYTTCHMDSFSWGKTRRVISEETNEYGARARKETSLEDAEATIGLRRTATW